MGIVHKTDANTDINVDRPDNSDPGSISDVNLFKCGVQDTQEGQPMKELRSHVRRTSQASNWP